MSFKEFVKYPFLSLKNLPKEFQVYVKGYREMETKFGLGHYLIVQLVQTAKNKKSLEGLLKISATTGASIASHVPQLEHLRDLETYLVSFAFDPEVKTIMCTEVKEWGQ